MFTIFNLKDDSSVTSQTEAAARDRSEQMTVRGIPHLVACQGRIVHVSGCEIVHAPDGDYILWNRKVTLTEEGKFTRFAVGPWSLEALTHQEPEAFIRTRRALREAADAGQAAKALAEGLSAGMASGELAVPAGESPAAQGQANTAGGGDGEHGAGSDAPTGNVAGADGTQKQDTAANAASEASTSS